MLEAPDKELLGSLLGKEQFECVDVELESNDAKKGHCKKRTVPKRQIQLKRKERKEAGFFPCGDCSAHQPLPPARKEPPAKGRTISDEFRINYKQFMKTASLDDACSKTRMASCLVKNVLAKKMQYEQRIKMEQKALWGSSTSSGPSSVGTDLAGDCLEGNPPSAARAPSPATGPSPAPRGAAPRRDDPAAQAAPSSIASSTVLLTEKTILFPPPASAMEEAEGHRKAATSAKGPEATLQQPLSSEGRFGSPGASGVSELGPPPGGSTQLQPMKPAAISTPKPFINEHLVSSTGPREAERERPDAAKQPGSWVVSAGTAVSPGGVSPATTFQAREVSEEGRVPKGPSVTPALLTSRLPDRRETWEHLTKWPGPNEQYFTASPVENTNYLTIPVKAPKSTPAPKLPSVSNPASASFGTPLVPNRANKLFRHPSVSNPASTAFGTPLVSNPSSTPFGAPLVPNPSSTSFGIPLVTNPVPASLGHPSVSNPASSSFGSPLVPNPAAASFGSPLIPNPASPASVGSVSLLPAGEAPGSKASPKPPLPQAPEGQATAERLGTPPQARLEDAPHCLRRTDGASPSSKSTPSPPRPSAPHLSTHRKMLVDPDSGKCYYMEPPRQPQLKMLYDPETGQYLEVLIPPVPLASHAGLYQAPFNPLVMAPGVYGPPYMPYTGFPGLPPPVLPTATSPAHPDPQSQPTAAENTTFPTAFSPAPKGEGPPAAVGPDCGYLDSLFAFLTVF
nr:PREDICTED: proline-rich basic protein 1 [Struthio camelus australis]